MDKAKYDRKTNVGLLGKCHTNAFVDSITEVARILGVSAFAKIPIRELLAESQSTIENQNIKELKLFQ